MSESPEIAAAIERARAACADTASRLASAGIAREYLAEYVEPRRGFLRVKPPTMRAMGEVWRLGALLLTDSGELYALGHATRAAERGRPGYQSLSREERREIAAAALRGGYAVGDEVNYGAAPIPLDLTPDAGTDLPVGYDSGEFRVRWRVGAPLLGAPTLTSYLTERANLLIDPPFSER